MGWEHKLVNQVPASRLKLVISKLVRDSQSTFIQGRSTFEGWIVASEMVKVMKHSGTDVYLSLTLKKNMPV